MLLVCVWAIECIMKGSLMLDIRNGQEPSGVVSFTVLLRKEFQKSWKEQSGKGAVLSSELPGVFKEHFSPVAVLLSDLEDAGGKVIDGYEGMLRLNRVFLQHAGVPMFADIADMPAEMEAALKSTMVVLCGAKDSVAVGKVRKSLAYAKAVDSVSERTAMGVSISDFS